MVATKRRSKSQPESAEAESVPVAPVAAIVPRRPRGPNRGVTKVGQAIILRSVYEALPEAEWERVLESQPAGSAGERLLAMMTDPAFSAWGLERRCSKAGVEFRDLVRMVSEHSLGAAIIESAKHAPEIVSGIAEDAKTRSFVCDLCLNLRAEGADHTTIQVAHPRNPEIMLEIECPKCGGTGRTTRGGDARARETYLKLHGGLEEAANTNVVVPIQMNFGAQHSVSVQRGQQLLAAGRNTSNSVSKGGA
jgi:hypothetical protein